MNIIIVSPGMKHDGNTISVSSLGGSETAAIQLAEAFASQKDAFGDRNRVVVVSNCDAPMGIKGVMYIPIASGQELVSCSDIDMLIVSRDFGILQTPHNAKVCYLWCHDLALKRTAPNFRGTLTQVDKVLLMSQFQKNQYKKIYELPNESIEVIRNGIDLALIPDGINSVRNSGQIVYCARPERGLENLVKENGIMEKLLKKELPVKLMVAHYDNTVPEMKSYYDFLWERCRSLSNVQLLGSLTKAQLYDLYSRSWAYVYPTDFEEISPLRGDSLIDTPGGRITIEQLWKERKENFPIYAYDPKKGRMVLATSKKVIKTRINTTMVKIRFKWGFGRTANKIGEIVLTPDHEIMMKDGSYKKAIDLFPGSRIMPFNRTPGHGQFTNIEGEIKKYNLISLNNGKRVPEHRFVMEEILGRPLNKEEIIDHIDGDPQNNDPSNLRVTLQGGHIKNHWKRMSSSKKMIESKKRSDAIERYHNSLSKEELSEVKRNAANIRWERHRSKDNHIVLSVEYVENADAYCMEVPNVHNFVANGIVVHNCISAMEAQACGLPFITTPLAALEETLHPDATRFIIPSDFGTASTESYQNEFVRTIEKLLGDIQEHTKMAKAGIEHGKTLGWNPVAKRLLDLSDEIMRKKSSNPARLYKHFFKNSDIEMCRRLEAVGDTLAWVNEHQDHPLRLVEKEVNFVKDNFKFTFSPDAYREQYEKVDSPIEGTEHQGARIEHFETSGEEPRWLVVKDFLETTGPYERILDYGCWIGHQTIRMANLLPETQFVGIDITSKTIETANECKAKYSEHKNINFISTDEMKSIKETNDFGNEEYDLIFCNEVLEHVLDPYSLIRKLEASCKEGGTVYFTLPYGPWEYLSFYTYPYRCHIRHYEMNDILDIFGNKKDIKVFFRATGRTDFGDVIGHHFISYTKDSSIPTEKVNLERKMAWQAPRETLSVCMIAYNSEDLLHRCLKSVSKLADEIIIAVDPKTTDSTVEIAKKYGAKIIDGIDPLKEGFGAARNLSIKNAKGDWIFWIDSDEVLLNPENVFKYLRPNPFNGYGIQQHHLSVDPPNPYKPDLPTRLFRNNRGAKFFGLIHEHPELELNKGFGLGIVMPDFWIGHDGYLTEKIRRSRFHRNIDLLLRDYKECPDRDLMKFLFMRDCIHIIKDRMDRMPLGSGPDNFCLEWARRAKHIFETKFLPDPGSPIMLDAIELYSSANALLGLGQDLIFTFLMNGIELRDVKTRFPNSEIASQIVGGILKHQMALREGKYV